MLDTHEKVKNALSNGAEETPAEPEVMGIEATPTPQPRNHMPFPTFGKRAPEEDSSDEDSPSKKPAPKNK